eukprot:Lankesteria_metandrocarpae@DN5046_c0_g1_i5.p1
MRRITRNSNKILQSESKENLHSPVQRATTRSRRVTRETQQVESNASQPPKVESNASQPPKVESNASQPPKVELNTTRPTRTKPKLQSKERVDLAPTQQISRECSEEPPAKPARKERRKARKPRRVKQSQSPESQSSALASPAASSPAAVNHENVLENNESELKNNETVELTEYQTRTETSGISEPRVYASVEVASEGLADNEATENSEAMNDDETVETSEMLDDSKMTQGLKVMENTEILEERETVDINERIESGEFNKENVVTEPCPAQGDCDAITQWPEPKEVYHTAMKVPESAFSLPLLQECEVLCRLYSGLETAWRDRRQRHQPLLLSYTSGVSSLSRHVERLTHSDFRHSQVRSLTWLASSLVRLSWKKKPKYDIYTSENDHWDLELAPSDPITMQPILRQLTVAESAVRENTFHRYCLLWTKFKHDALLAASDPPIMPIPFAALHRWHSNFNLMQHDDDTGIPLAPVPVRPWIAALASRRRMNSATLRSMSPWHAARPVALNTTNNTTGTGLYTPNNTTGTGLYTPNRRPSTAGAAGCLSVSVRTTGTKQVVKNSTATFSRVSLLHSEMATPLRALIATPQRMRPRPSASTLVTGNNNDTGTDIHTGRSQDYIDPHNNNSAVQHTAGTDINTDTPRRGRHRHTTAVSTKVGTAHGTGHDIDTPPHSIAVDYPATPPRQSIPPDCITSPVKSPVSPSNNHSRIPLTPTRRRLKTPTTINVPDTGTDMKARSAVMSTPVRSSVSMVNTGGDLRTPYTALARLTLNDADNNSNKSVCTGAGTDTGMCGTGTGNIGAGMSAVIVQPRTPLRSTPSVHRTSSCAGSSTLPKSPFVASALRSRLGLTGTGTPLKNAVTGTPINRLGLLTGTPVRLKNSTGGIGTAGTPGKGTAGTPGRGKLLGSELRCMTPEMEAIWKRTKVKEREKQLEQMLKKNYDDISKNTRSWEDSLVCFQQCVSSLLRGSRAFVRLEAFCIHLCTGRGKSFWSSADVQGFTFERAKAAVEKVCAVCPEVLQMSESKSKTGDFVLTFNRGANLAMAKARLTEQVNVAREEEKTEKHRLMRLYVPVQTE